MSTYSRPYLTLAADLYAVDDYAPGLYADPYDTAPYDTAPYDTAPYATDSYAPYGYEPLAPAPVADYAPGDESWRQDALCAETDPEAFFPEKGGSTREAKRVCVGCPVRMQCLEYALDNDERFGIWGGLSERERRRVKLSRREPLSA